MEPTTAEKGAAPPRVPMPQHPVAAAPFRAVYDSHPIVCVERGQAVREAPHVLAALLADGAPIVEADELDGWTVCPGCNGAVLKADVRRGGTLMLANVPRARRRGFFFADVVTINFAAGELLPRWDARLWARARECCGADAFDVTNMGLYQFVCPRCHQTEEFIVEAEPSAARDEA